MEETKTTVASKDEIASGENLAKANDIVRNRVYWSMGAGLVPIPIIDMAALLAIQLEMVSKLAKVYDQSFRRDIAKSAIIALLGSVIPTLAAGPMASLLKIIPVIGYTTGAVSMSLIGGAGTYAVGKVFTKHFESGGTLFDFDPTKTKEEFTKSFEEGKGVVGEMKNNA